MDDMSNEYTGYLAFSSTPIPQPRGSQARCQRPHAPTTPIPSFVPETQHVHHPVPADDEDVEPN